MILVDQKGLSLTKSLDILLGIKGDGLPPQDIDPRVDIWGHAPSGHIPQTLVVWLLSLYLRDCLLRVCRIDQSGSGGCMAWLIGLYERESERDGCTR
jgi:hypothetical protein